MAWWDDAAEAVGSGLGWVGDAAEAVVDTVTEVVEEVTESATDAADAGLDALKMAPRPWVRHSALWPISSWAS